MNKYFTKEALAVTKTTYKILGIIFLVIFFTPRDFSFIDFGPLFDATAICVLAFPIILVIMIIRICSEHKEDYKNTIFEYIVLTAIINFMLFVIDFILLNIF